MLPKIKRFIARIIIKIEGFNIWYQLRVGFLIFHMLKPLEHTRLEHMLKPVNQAELSKLNNLTPDTCWTHMHPERLGRL